MRRRLDLGCSLISHPQVIFLDEPTTGLDPRSRQAVWSVIRGLAGAGVTTFLTTQYLEEADVLAAASPSWTAAGSSPTEPPMS
jgi:ABC-2 type transport system ATP-binding protein